MLKATVDFIEAKIKSELGDFIPEIGIVLGSGLGELADEFCTLAIPYCEIPGFEASSVSGHKSRLVFAEINGKKVVMMQGRFHYYEGHSIQKVVFPIKVMKKLGVKTVVLTNADLKIYQIASPSVRAKRRYDENLTKGITTPLETIEQEIKHRDYLDMNKGYGALKKADDAIELDTSYMSIEEVVDFIYNKALELM